MLSLTLVTSNACSGSKMAKSASALQHVEYQQHFLFASTTNTHDSTHPTEISPLTPLSPAILAVLSLVHSMISRIPNLEDKADLFLASFQRRALPRPREEIPPQAVEKSPVSRFLSSATQGL